MCFSIVLYIFSMRWSAYFKWRKVYTHQFDVLSVHQDPSSDGTFVDVLCVDDSLPPPFVQHNSNSVFVVVFFPALMKICL